MAILKIGHSKKCFGSCKTYQAAGLSPAQDDTQMFNAFLDEC